MLTSHENLVTSTYFTVKSCFQKCPKNNLFVVLFINSKAQGCRDRFVKKIRLSYYKDCKFGKVLGSWIEKITEQGM